MKVTILIFAILASALGLMAGASQQQYSPPAASSAVLAGIDFNSAKPLDESYRAEFETCDKEDKFRNQKMGGFRKCSTDKNRVKALLKFPNGTILFESKLSLDIDGSWKACFAAGVTDQCATWFRWQGQAGVEGNVDADKYPYVVIPIAGLGGINDMEFRNKSAIAKGDLGVVVFQDKVVPVFVADGGPHNKLGEGSIALLKAIGEDRCRLWRDGHCESVRNTSVPAGVLFFLFPNSKLTNLTPQNANERVKIEALRLFEELKASH